MSLSAAKVASHSCYADASQVQEGIFEGNRGILDGQEEKARSSPTAGKSPTSAHAFVIRKREPPGFGPAAPTERCLQPSAPPSRPLAFTSPPPPVKLVFLSLLSLPRQALPQLALPMQPSQDWSAPSPPPLRPVATSSADSSSAFSSAPSPRAAAATTGSRPPPTQLPAGKPRSFRNSGFSLSLPPPTPATGSGGQNPFDLIGSSSGAAGGGISGIVSSDGQGPLGQQQHQQNPWAHLMASSGAPTPAIKGALSPFTFGGASEGPFAPPPPPKSSSPRPPTLANGKRPAQQGVFSPDVKAMRELSLKEGAHGLPGNGNGGGFAQHQPFTLSGIPGAGPPGRPPHQRVPSANGSGQGALAPPAQSSFRLSPPGGMPSLPGGRVAGGSVAGGGRIPFGSGSCVVFVFGTSLPHSLSFPS